MKMQTFPTTAGDVSCNTELRFVGVNKLRLEDIESREKFDFAIHQLLADNRHFDERLGTSEIEKPTEEQFKAIHNRGTIIELILIKGREVQVRSGIGVLFTLKDKGYIAI